MKRIHRKAAGTLAALGLLLGLGPAARGASPERWLHLKVDSGRGHAETVRINLPLSLAEKVIPAIKANELHSGRITIGNTSINGVDFRTLAEALRDTNDTEFVNVEEKDETVHISKKGGDLLIKVREKDEGRQNVDITVPFAVVQALCSGPKDQLDLMAGLRALEAYGDATLVTVNDEDENVRIWVDSRSSSD